MTNTVIVPNYNGITILRKCLVSLLEHDRVPDQIVVVDNGSSDGSPNIIRKEFPQVSLVALEKNTGFTGGNNAGLRASTGDMLVLLNNDCIVEPNWLNCLMNRMADPSIAAVTSSMRNIKNIDIMDSAGGQIDWMGFSRDIGRGEQASRHSKLMEISSPCGGAVIVRRNALHSESHIFWNDLFVYQEDLDLGFELLRTGWKVVYEPNAIVRHVHSATAGSSGSFFKEYHCIRNRLLVMRKHFDRKTFRKLSPTIKKWQILWAFSSLAKGEFVLAKAILIGTSDGFKMPVEPFIAPIPINDIFARFAHTSNSTSSVKAKMYNKMESIIRQGCSCENHSIYATHKRQ